MGLHLMSQKPKKETRAKARQITLLHGTNFQMDDSVTLTVPRLAAKIYGVGSVAS